MATIFAHGLVATLLKKIISKNKHKRILSLCILLSILPDIDVIGFSIGVEYAHPLGHRGFTHSIFFAVLISFFLAQISFKRFQEKRISLFILYFLCTISHGVLDSLTNGGLGVGFLIPFDNGRYFAPFTPIQVSPIGRNFFSMAGLETLASEVFWVLVPVGILFVGKAALDHFLSSKKS